MTKRIYAASERPKREPTHPGSILRDDVLPALDMSVSAAARALGVSRQTLHRILAGTGPVTPEMAVRLGKFCGNGPDLWANMQTRYDLWHAAKSMRSEVGTIRTHRAA